MDCGSIRENITLSIEAKQGLNLIMPKISRKRYSKLNEGIIRGYMASHLKDIQLRGRDEAKKTINKLISNKKGKVDPEIIDFVSQNIYSWTNFAYSVASMLDNDALIGFFVPFIYGGLLSYKNMTGEAIGIVNIQENDGKLAKNARFSRIACAIAEIKGRGVGIIVVSGVPGDIYSAPLLNLYQSSQGECFIIIERNDSSFETPNTAHKSIYGREVLSALNRSKNVFIILDEEASDITARSKALSSYGILHGAFAGEENKKPLSVTEKGSFIAFFDQKLSLETLILKKISDFTDINDIAKVFPPSFMGFLASPRLPLKLPDLMQTLCAIQYATSGGKLDKIEVDNV